MASELMASFEIGAREAGVRLITWPDIFKSDNLPEETRTSPSPTPSRLLSRGNAPGRRRRHAVRRRSASSTARIIISSARIEADCDSEGLESANFERSSIFKNSPCIWRSSVPNAIDRISAFEYDCAILTTNATHLENMKRLLYDLTKGAGSASIVFGNRFPHFTTFEPPLPPSGHALSTT